MAASLLLLLSASLVAAQSVTDIRPSVSRPIPGTTSDVQRQLDQRPQLDQTDPGVLPDDPTAREQLPLTGGTTLSFILSGITFSQPSTVFDDDELAAIYESFIGTEVTIGSLREIANRIEQFYREEGYLATRVIIPQQTIENGIASLEIFEGKIIYYEVNGDIGPVKEQIAALMDNLLTDKPARWAELERYLLLARDLPGISLTGTLRQAGDSAPGGVILVVDTARKPIDGFFNFQNRNPVPTGAFTATGGAAANSNTKYAERVGAIALLALEVPEQVSGQAVYEQSLGNDGVVFRIESGLSFSEPKDELEDLKLNAISTDVRAELEYPIVRSRGLSVWSRGGAFIADQRASTNGQEFFDDQLRGIYAGLRGLWFAPFSGIAEFDVELRRGFDHFGASKSSRGRSRPDSEAEYNLIRGDVAYTQPIGDVFEVYGKFGFQMSDVALNSYEEMALGELTFGRGFEPGSITGERGFGATAEIRFAPPGTDVEWIDQLQFYGFWDYGRVYDLGEPTGEEFEDLTSIGMGLRFQLFQSLLGNVYLASPQSDALSTSVRKPNSTVKFTLTQFF
ncbi:MAG: POTRA domain-containing protein [Pseudomonadota bacterium]